MLEGRTETTALLQVFTLCVLTARVHTQRKLKQSGKNSLLLAVDYRTATPTAPGDSMLLMC